jgi:hypothetical protein
LDLGMLSISLLKQNLCLIWESQATGSKKADK